MHDKDEDTDAEKADDRLGDLAMRLCLGVRMFLAMLFIPPPGWRSSL